MTITTTRLTRAAGLGAVAAGLLFIGVQINHPHLDVNLVTSTEWIVRESAKMLMAVLALAGITAMYLRQVRATGLLGLIGYLLLATGFLIILGVQVVGVFVLPTLAHSEPGYVNDVLAVAAGAKAAGDIGLMGPLGAASGLAYLGGGLLFGIALFRANILARWAAALLAAGTVASAAIPLLPQVNPRLFAVPTGIALIGLGYSLWREQRGAGTASPSPAELDLAGVK